MSFPGALRDAIPSPGSHWGRCLVLDSVDGQCQHTVEFGKRVQVRFVVTETGKLTGRFNVYADLDVDAARGLAGSLQQLADRAERLRPVRLTGRVVGRKRKRG